MRRRADASGTDARLPGQDRAEDPRRLRTDGRHLRQHRQSAARRAAPRLHRAARAAAGDEGGAAGRRRRVRARLRGRRSRRARDPRPERVRGIQGRRAQPRAVDRCRRWRAVAEHRRPRPPGRRRLLLPHRAEEGTDHPRRPQHRPGEHRGAAAPAPGRAARRRGRPPRCRTPANSRSPMSSSSRALRRPKQNCWPSPSAHILERAAHAQGDPDRRGDAADRQSARSSSRQLRQREIEDALAEALRRADVSLVSVQARSDPAHGTVVEVSLAEPADPQVARRVLGQFPLPFRLVDEAGRPAQAQAPNPSPLEKK